MQMKKIAVLLALSLLSMQAALAKVVTEEVKYQDGDTQLTGFISYDDAQKGPRPGVIVVHEWWGLNQFAQDKAKELASMGYVAMAIDMYGDGKVTNHPAQAKEWMQTNTMNKEQWRRRASLGLEQLTANAGVDKDRLAAIGYCFGGATVMQMAYAGTPLNGVVSLHGSLPPATQEEASKIQSKVLVLHGEADAFVPAERIVKFKNALAATGADWQFVGFGGARHAFTNPEAGQYGIENLKYDAAADQRSWAYTQEFLAEVLK